MTEIRVREVSLAASAVSPGAVSRRGGMLRSLVEDRADRLLDPRAVLAGGADRLGEDVEAS